MASGKFCASLNVISVLNRNLGLYSAYVPINVGTGKWMFIKATILFSVNTLSNMKPDVSMHTLSYRQSSFS